MEKRKRDYQYELRDFSTVGQSTGRRGGRSAGANTVRYTGATARLLSSPAEPSVAAAPSSPLVEQHYLFAEPPKASSPTQPAQTQTPVINNAAAVAGGGGGGGGWTTILLAALTVVILAAILGGVAYLIYSSTAFVTEKNCIDSLKSERRHFWNVIVPQVNDICPPPADNPYYYWDEECQKPHVLNFLINGWSAHNQ